MFRFDGDVFLFGTAMAEKLLQTLMPNRPSGAPLQGAQCHLQGAGKMSAE
jgi:hypothetical protein